MLANSRITRLACLVLTSIALSTAAAPAWSDDTKTKGLFLYNLAKYVTWPDGAFASDSSPIVIGVVNDEGFVSEMEELVEGYEVQGRDLKVVSVDASKATRGVHLVYFPDRNYGRLREQASLFDGHPAIRVAEHKRFVKFGDVGFVMRDGRVMFYVNGRNTKREGMKLSSKFLRLASGVE